MRISYWSADVCSTDLPGGAVSGPAQCQPWPAKRGASMAQVFRAHRGAGGARREHAHYASTVPSAILAVGYAFIAGPAQCRAGILRRAERSDRKQTRGVSPGNRVPVLHRALAYRVRHRQHCVASAKRAGYPGRAEMTATDTPGVDTSASG